MFRALCMLLLFGCGLAPAAPSFAAAPDFMSNWMATPTLKRSGPGGSYEAKILERFVTAGKATFEIGNVVYFSYPKALNKAPFDPKEVAAKLGRAMGIQKWNQRRVKQAYVFENDWAEQLRYVRIFMVEDADSIRYSVAVFRTAYIDSVIFESEIIQRRLLGVLEKRIPWLERMFSAVESTIGIACAYAQGMPCNTNCAPWDTGCLIAAQQCSEGQLIQQLSNANQNAQNYGPKIDGLNTNLANSNTNWANSNSNWGASNANWQTSNQNWATSNQNWATTNAEFKRTNDLLAQFMDPGHAFMWAAASAAGAAVGVMAVNLAVDALAAGGKAVIEMITHEQEEKEILERFQAAKDGWTKTTQAAAQLEQAIDGLLGLKQLMKKYGKGREYILKSFDTEIAIMGSELRKKTKLLDKATEDDNADCKALYGAETGALTSQIAEFTWLQKRFKEAESDTAICGKLVNGLMDLRNMEATLQNARGDLLKGQGVWAKNFDKETERTKKSFEYARDHTESDYKDDCERAEKDYKKAVADQWNWKQNWMAWCISNHAADVPGVGWTSQIPIIGIWRVPAFQGDCKSKWAKEKESDFQNRLGDIDYAFLKMKEAREARHAERLKNKDDLWLNWQTQLGGKTANLEWFTKIESDQICLSKPDQCDPNGDGLMLSRFERLAKKGELIKASCPAFYSKNK